MVQLSQPYVTTGKTMALTIQIFVSKVMSLIFNTLSRFVKAFLLRSNCLLISWLQSPSTVMLEPKKKSVTASTFSPSICHEVIRPRCHYLSFFFNTEIQSYLLIFSYCLWGSYYTEEGCHFLLQWTMFCHNFSLWFVCIGWPSMAWLIASLSYSSPLATTELWSMKG